MTDPLSLFWLFFIFAGIQPAIKQILLIGARQRTIAKIDGQRRSRVYPAYQQAAFGSNVD